MSPRAHLAAFASFVVCFAFSSAAFAHQVGLSRGEYRVKDAGVRADVTFSQGDVLALVEGADADGNGKLSRDELAKIKDALEKRVVSKIDVKGDGEACSGKLESVDLDEEDGVHLTARFTCSKAPAHVAIALGFFDDLSFGHRHIARGFGGGEPVDAVLFGASRTLSIDVAPGGASADEKPRPAYKGKFSFFPLGIEHILTGYDHLVFLLALVLIGGRVKDLLATVTAFTLAHSISLALAVLGVWAPSPRIVEPAIALSIAYVGLENFFVKDGKRRWRITFPFGLIHGFGFAGALQEIAMPKADVPWALVLFNLGVESGQLMVLAVVLPLVLFARKNEAFRLTGVKLMSAGIVAAGVIWFVLRAFVSTS